MPKNKRKSFISIFGYDLTHHFLYTVFIVVITILSTITFRSHVVPVANSQTHEDFGLEKDMNYKNRVIPHYEGVIFHGDRNKKRVALTFDADMTPGMKNALNTKRIKSSYDSRIVDTLNKTNTKATLFLTGMWIEVYPDITKQLAHNPLFELGSHSYRHSSYNGYCYGLSQLPQTLKIEDVGAAQKLLRDYTGTDNKLFRFPGGCYSAEDVGLIHNAGGMVVDWDVVSGDAFNNNTNEIVYKVVNNTQNGSIIVMHLNGEPTAPKTAEALPEIIKQLKAKGYEFVTVSQLLNL